MFGSAKKSSNDFGNDDIETVIGKSTQIKGTISGTSNIRIDGNIEGEVIVQGDVVVGEQGNVIASIKANSVLISGTVTGNVEVKGKLELLGTGKLCGDVKATVLSIAEGAVFKGNSHMEISKESAKEASAHEQKSK